MKQNGAHPTFAISLAVHATGRILLHAMQKKERKKCPCSGVDFCSQKRSRSRRHQTRCCSRSTARRWRNHRFLFSRHIPPRSRPTAAGFSRCVISRRHAKERVACVWCHYTYESGQEFSGYRISFNLSSNASAIRLILVQL